LTTDARLALRREFRARRRAIAPAIRAAAADRAARVLAAAGLPKRASRVAAYLPADGEFDPAPLVAHARARGCRLYVPVLTALHGRMLFGPLDAPPQAWRVNRYGLREPGAMASLLCRPQDLDLVLAPLVAFDAAGHRLGMGGGYYDRAFAFLRQRGTWRSTRLLGLAFDVQQAAAIEAAPWDVPLWGVLTESRLLRFGARPPHAPITTDQQGPACSTG
jgi:5-formyltetrahydrofolate cyclo-ligase